VNEHPSRIRRTKYVIHHLGLVQRWCDLRLIPPWGGGQEWRSTLGCLCEKMFVVVAGAGNTCAVWIMAQIGRFFWVVKRRKRRHRRSRYIALRSVHSNFASGLLSPSTRTVCLRRDALRIFFFLWKLFFFQSNISVFFFFKKRGMYFWVGEITSSFVWGETMTCTG